MSHPAGTYLGGIRTVEDLRQRCRVAPDTGCWHWGLACVQGFPKVHFVTPDTVKRTAMRGRRAALYLARGKDIGAGRMAYPTSDCDAMDCVNPVHARSGTRAQHGAHMRHSGRSRTAAKVASALNGASKRRKLTQEQVDHIRASDKPILALAAEYGVSQFCVWAVRAGKTWRSTLPASSVFDWGRTAANAPRSTEPEAA